MRDTETMRYAKARQKKESNTFPGHRSHTTYTHNNKGPEKELDIKHTKSPLYVYKNSNIDRMRGIPVGTIVLS